MTCGVCHPESFRYAGKDMRVLGYVVAFRPSQAAVDTRRLHYLGAELVFTDQPDGKVIHRPAFRLLRKVLRSGDKLILPSFKALGSRFSYQKRNSELLEAEGIEIALVNTEYFDEG